MLAYKQLRIDLGTAGKVIASFKRGEQRGPGNLEWVGGLPGEGDHVVLTVVDGDVTGLIRAGGTTFSIEPLGQGLHALTRIDYSKMPPDEPPGFEESLPQDTVSNSATYPDEKIGGPSSSFTITTGAEPATANLLTDPVIDVLVAYTPVAASASGNISSVIQGSIDIMNDGFDNSSVPASVNLVHQVQVTYTETGSSLTDVNRLHGSTDGYMDNIHSLRNQYGADVVVLILSSTDACGRVYAIGEGASSAFAVVEWNCAVGNYSFPHEIGHLAGARHDNDGNTIPYVYGHGYDYAPANWRTIMATDLSLDRINYWSNPDKTLGGVAMGTASYNDNVHVWENRAGTLAGFRTAASAPPLAPSGLTISGSTGDHPQLSWNASSGATGYKVYRCYYYSGHYCSGEPANHEYIGSTSSTSYTDTESLLASSGDLIYYYVKAYNGSGSSPESSGSARPGGPALKAAPELPGVFALHGNAPNPFSRTTEIRFDLPEAAHVRLAVYNMLGQEVRELVNADLPAGFQHVTLSTEGLPSGVYLYRITAGTFTETKRMVVAK
ncbi:MAG TPA: zinc-dependent metalloprotease [Rhodothermales bacterium]|nr:zinc-dependent metalloprotease [Rhodothermales bacterium]